MPCDYNDYPANWKTHIVPAIRERSGDRCEWCGYRNRAHRYTRHAGSTRIILTVAHIDHDLSHNDDMDEGGPALPLEQANLVHLCQRCHLNHDRPKHLETRSVNRVKATGQMDISEL